MAKDKKSGSKVWQSFGLYGSLSLNLAIMVMGGFFIGNLLEVNYHLTNMKFTGTLLGLFLGFYQMFVVAFQAVGKK